MTKELIGRSITATPTTHIRRGDFEDLAAVIEGFNSRDRSAFLRSFFEVYREGAGRIFLAHEGGRIVGGGIGKVNDRNRDLIEVDFLAGDDATRLALLSHLEYQSSKEGARWLGVATRKKAFVNKLSARGYEIAHLPEWWTLYHMVKDLSEGGLSS